jgi:hypothetical protein
MTCRTLKLPTGHTAIVCSRGRRPPPKCKCGSGLEADILCDFPDGKGHTCDIKLCRSCAVKQGPDVDYCPFHDGRAKAKRPVQMALL